MAAPRVLNTLVASVLIAASSVPVVSDHDVTGIFLLGIPAALGGVLALRVRTALLDGDALLLTGYVRAAPSAIANRTTIDGSRVSAGGPSAPAADRP